MTGFPILFEGITAISVLGSLVGEGCGGWWVPAGREKGQKDQKKENDMTADDSVRRDDSRIVLKDSDSSSRDRHWAVRSCKGLNPLAVRGLTPFAVAPAGDGFRDCS